MGVRSGGGCGRSAGCGESVWVGVMSRVGGRE